MMTHNTAALLHRRIAPAVAAARAVQCRPRPLLRASLVSAFLLLFIQTSSALAAAVAPPLGTAGTYTVLGTNAIPTSGTVTCTNTGPGSTINGDVGSTFTSITDTSCSIVGTTDAPVAGSVVSDFNNAYSALNSLNPTCDGVIPTTSTILPPGVYCSTAGTTIGTGVTFTLNGSATDVWVFRIGTGGLGALTGTGFSVVMGGSALACNVYWRTAEATTMTDSDFIGTVLAGTAVTMTRGSWEGRALAKTDVTVTDAASMTFAGCGPPNSITVNKNFVPDDAATVPMALTCTSGTVSTTPLNAAEGAPAVFMVGGADLSGTTCTATETVPAGYAAVQTNCEDVPLNGSCTIVNTLEEADTKTITVIKDFSPDSPASVSVGLVCTGAATVDATPLNASEGVPAVFTVSNAVGGETCTATENPVPTGYTPNQTDCEDVPLNGACTIVNTLADNAITVYKDFIPNNAATVSVGLQCTGAGSVDNSPQNASEGAPAVFTVTDGDETTSCTATENPVPAGYSAGQTNCIDVPLGGNCTITNLLNTDTIRVEKVYADGLTTPVDVTMTCQQSGNVDGTGNTFNTKSVAGGGFVSFTVTGFNQPSDASGQSTQCVITESDLPPDYFQVRATGCTQIMSHEDNSELCQFVNSPDRATFRISKIWNQGGETGAIPVTGHLSCTGGNPTQQNVVFTATTDAILFVYDIGQANGPVNCTVTEDVPENYTAQYRCDIEHCGDSEQEVEGCFFPDVLADNDGLRDIGEYVCTIYNTPDSAHVTVTKTWVIEGANQGFDDRHFIIGVCDSELDGPTDEELCPLANHCYAAAYEESASAGSKEYEFTILQPLYPSTSCIFFEDTFDSVVESDNGCGEMELSAGDDVACEIVNTVFFEGIPTLSPYGMAILTLLMLGVGFVGLRRLT